MKRKLLVLPLVATLGGLALSSYSGGPYASGSLNRTGAASSQANCSGSGCHAANTTSTNVIITVTNAGGNPVTSYTPGATYTVRISGANTNALTHFGFQSTAVRAAATSTQAGTFSASGSVSVRTASTPDLVEQNTPIAGTVTGGNAVYTTTYTWVAPAAGAGAVRFYATLNAVNRNGQAGGDEPAAATPVDLSETPGNGTSVPGVSAASLKVYPNPATSSLSLQLPDAISQGHYQIRDIRGGLVGSGELRISQGQASVELGSLSAGAYFIQVQSNAGALVTPFVKQ